MCALCQSSTKGKNRNFRSAQRYSSESLVSKTFVVNIFLSEVDLGVRSREPIKTIAGYQRHDVTRTRVKRKTPVCFLLVLPVLSSRCSIYKPKAFPQTLSNSYALFVACNCSQNHPPPPVISQYGINCSFCVAQHSAERQTISENRRPFPSDKCLPCLVIDLIF